MERRILLVCTLIFFTKFGYSQVNLNNQVLVYFQTGVQRNAPANTSSTITSSNVLNLLSNYAIPTLNVIPSFPTFNESDTVSFELGEDSRQMNRAKVFTITVTNSATIDNFVTDLNALTEVVYAELNGDANINIIPIDGRFSQQWGLRNTIKPGADIHVEQAWNIFTGNPNAIIAVIDNGVDVSHNDLNAKILGGDNGYIVLTDGLGRPFSHGSHVAGIAAAITNNSGNNGVAGVDWQARIHPKNVFDVGGDADITQSIIDAVDYSPNVWTLTNSYSLENVRRQPRYSTTVRSAFAYVYRKNRVSCAAMGNFHSGLPNSNDPTAYPVGFNSGLIAIGATDINDNAADFSARGSHIDVSAPGVNIWSTNFNNDYIDLTGTSMATPYVAGLASLLKGYNTSLANDDIKQIIRLSADDVNNSLYPGFDNQLGTGRINAQSALQLLQAPNTLQQLSASGGTIYGSTANLIRTFLGVPNFRDGVYFGMERVEVRKDITFTPMCSIIGVWGRGVGSTGYNEDGGKCFGEGFCEVVPGTLTSTGCTLRTYIYKFANTYFPTNPNNVVFQYTVLGIPITEQILGDNAVCGTSNYYTITNLPAGATVTWNASPLNVVSINTPNATQTTITGTSSGVITLTATISIGCSQTVSKSNITVTGPPTITCQTIGNGSCSQQTTLCPSQLNTWRYFSIPNYNPPGATGFRLTVSGNGYFSGGATVKDISTAYWETHDIGVYVSGNCDVTVRPFNSCGISTYVPYDVAYRLGYFCTYSYSVSPNPATSSLTISSDTKNSSATNKSGKFSLVEIEIVDKLGNLKKRHKLPVGLNATTIDVSYLPADTYIVRVFDGINWEDHKILIVK